MTNLTELELKGLKGIAESDYHDGNHPMGNHVWTWSANPFDSLKTFSGVSSSLNKKGFAESFEDGKDSTIKITEAGWAALAAADAEYVAKFD